MKLNGASLCCLQGPAPATSTWNSGSTLNVSKWHLLSSASTQNQKTGSNQHPASKWRHPLETCCKSNSARFACLMQSKRFSSKNRKNVLEHLQKTYLIVITVVKPWGRLVRFLKAAERPHSCLCTSVQPDLLQKEAQYRKMVFDSILFQVKKKQKAYDCLDVRPGDWRIGAAWRSMSGMFVLEEDISDLHRSPCRSLLCLVWPVLSDEIQPAGYPDPIKGSSQVSFSEPEKESSHYARTAIVLRISSIEGFVSPPDKHPQSTAASLCSAFLIHRPTGNNRVVLCLCMSENRQTSYPSVGKWLLETLLLVKTNNSKPIHCMALINLMQKWIF